MERHIGYEIHFVTVALLMTHGHTYFRICSWHELHARQQTIDSLYWIKHYEVYCAVSTVSSDAQDQTHWTA